MKALPVLFALSLCCYTAVAQEGSTSEAWASHYTGSLHGLSRAYLQQADSPYYGWQAELRADVQAKWTYKEQLQFHLALLANANPEHSRRNRIWANEAYASYRSGHFFLKAGKQTVKWGALTGYSALDLANRYDYYDVLDTENERLGLWGLEARYYRGQTELQVRAFLPDNRSRLHLADNRWIHLPSRMPRAGVPGGFLEMAFAGQEATYSERLPLLGLAFSTELGAVQIRYSGLLGNNDIPLSQVEVQSVSNGQADYQLRLQYEPMLINAVNAATWLGDWNVWAEIAHVNSQRFQMPGQLSRDDYTFSSIGADRVWPFEHPEQQLRLVAQYLHVFAQPETPYEATELDHIFQSALMLDAKLQLNYRWHLAMRAVTDFASGGLYFEPKLGLRASDRCQMYLSADLLGGNEQSFFGYFSNNSRLAFHLTYHPF